MLGLVSGHILSHGDQSAELGDISGPSFHLHKDPESLKIEKEARVTSVNDGKCMFTRLLRATWRTGHWYQSCHAGCSLQPGSSPIPALVREASDAALYADNAAKVIHSFSAFL